MKRFLLRFKSSAPALVVLSLLIFFWDTRARGQAFSVTWSTVDGGGGTSAGGVYSVSGTIGQPDAGGAMSGGSYSVTGGFWSLFAVQSPGAPLLSIYLTPTNSAAILWPSTAVGWSLQQNTNLTSTNWVAVGTLPIDNGTNRTVIVSPPAGIRFFRLIK